jgi:hypothetical protein
MKAVAAAAAAAAAAAELCNFFSVHKPLPGFLTWLG